MRRWRTLFGESLFEREIIQKLRLKIIQKFFADCKSADRGCRIANPTELLVGVPCGQKSYKIYTKSNRIGALRAEIIQKFILKISQKLFLFGSRSSSEKDSANRRQSSLLELLRCSLSYLNLSKSIQNQTKSARFAWKLFKIKFKIIQNSLWRVRRLRTFFLGGALTGGNYSKMKFKIIQIFRRDVGMVGGVEKLRGIMGISV